MPEAQVLKGHLDVLLLAALADGPQHGYAIKQALRERSGGRFDLPTGTREFTRQSPGRRTALALLATGPVFAILWGTSLIGAEAWTWPIPAGMAVAFGAVLVGVAAVLVAVVTSDSYPRTRLASPACGILMLLDATMLATIALAAAALTWPMAFAIGASVARIGFSARSLARVR